MNQDSDFALGEIRPNKHDPRGPKTAVMVGVGFSLNAVSLIGPGKTKFPDWATLTKILIERLYTNLDERYDVLRSAGATSSALRLAKNLKLPTF